MYQISGFQRHSLWALIGLVAWPPLATAQSQAQAQGARVVQDESREAKFRTPITALAIRPKSPSVVSSS